MARPLEDRHVVITGSSGGLGKAVVEAFAAAGATCHLPVRGGSPPGGAAAALQSIPGIDLTAEGDVTRLYGALPPLWASIHLAGGYAGAPVADTGLALLRGQLDLNLVTGFLCSREAVRSFRRAGAGGRIVNVTSRAASVPSGGAIAYAASKAALEQMTRALAEEVKAEGILVNAVAPSTIDTAANRAAMPGADHRRWVRPEEIAEAILWLASPANTATSGTVVPVYGRA